MTYIEITWNIDRSLPATHIGDKEETTVSFHTEDVIGGHVEADASKAFCETIFHETNIYSGTIWDHIQPLLSPKRSHTALSIGDDVRVGADVYRCAEVGFELIEKEGRPYHHVTRSWFSGTPICLRCGALCEDDYDEEEGE
jgi:hypothetical protein